MTAFRFQDADLIVEGPLLNIWRAPTDNDGIKVACKWPHQLLHKWRKAGLDRLECRTESVSVMQPRPEAVQVMIVTTAAPEGLAPGLVHQHRYTVYGTGDVVVANQIHVDASLPPLPRVGVRMLLPSGLEEFEWYGRGPHENYVDRNAGAAVGRYRSTVTEQYVPYIMPQENGNRTDVRWLTLTGSNGAGLLVTAGRPLEASASHFTADDLYKALHTNELVPRPETILNLDRMQCGLGGASCGPGTLPQYLVMPGDWEFSFRLHPLADTEIDAAVLSRERLREVGS